MRPKRLEVEGFTAFREPAVVEFEGADLFAFVGPTGSGKSSLVDAMGFALYGRVHRYGEKLVHAAISSGSTEARVRLDFTVGGDDYTAVRVARRTGPGRATTKEARLERGGEVIAGDEKGLTAAVEDLLGLDFEQYCRCVVLPQGAFAAFLHDTPKGRQDLLTGLLDLGHYREMGQQAGQRAATAAARVAALEDRLQRDLAAATPEALARAEERVATLTALGQRLHAAAPEIEAAADRARQAVRHAQELEAQAALLATVQEPPDLQAVGAAITDATDRLVAATKSAEAAESAVAAAAADRAALGDRHPLDVARAAYRREGDIAARLAVLEANHEGAALAATSARAELDAAMAARGQADAAVEASRQANRAHALAVELTAGEPCPVCRQVVHDVPPLDEPADFADARGRAEQAAADERAARDTAADAQAGTARAAGELAAAQAQYDDVRNELSGAPAPEDVERRIHAIETAEAALAEARSAEQEARQLLRESTEAERAVRAAEHSARVAFEAERDRLAPLLPPAASRSDLAVDWRELQAWAVEKARALDAEKAARTAEAARLASEHERLRQEADSWCAEAGVELRGRSAGEGVAAAVADADARRVMLAQRVEEAAQVTAARDAAKEDEQVARLLALHLRSDHFEKWLLDEALEDLTVASTLLLRELSGGAYSLALDAKSRDFVVVDHRNADEPRPVRTLSGGETFLASLALALALADRIADLSSTGAARLEALFLDEGFGTLDPDTLDTVAAAIEHLGASGRMVGLVTHVRDLAERMPVRFEVAKGPRTAAVERVTV